MPSLLHIGPRAIARQHGQVPDVTVTQMDRFGLGRFNLRFQVQSHPDDKVRLPDAR